MLDSPRLAEAERELIQRRGLYEFVRRAWHVVETTPFVDSWHIGQQCAALEAMSKGQIRNLVDNQPPGTSKSLIASVLWPAWEWTWKPHSRWIVASFDASLVRRDSTRLLELLYSGWYRNRFPGVEPCNAGLKFSGWEGEQPAVGEFWNTKGGFRLSTSVGGKATGWHADQHLYDDPIKPKGLTTGKATSASETVLEGAWDWMKGTMSSRFRDKKRARRCVLMQRVHEGDPSGRALKEWKGCEHLVLPMRYDPERHFKVYGFQKGERVLVAEDQRTEAGELLCPERFPEEVVAEDEQHNMGPYIAAAQLQQRPSPAEGGMLEKENFRRYTEIPDRFDELITVTDCNFKQTTSGSFAVIDLWGRVGANAYLLPGWYRKRVSFAVLEKAFKEFHEKDLLHRMAVAKIVEDKANGPALISKMEDILPGVRGYPKAPGDSKESMFASITPYYASHNVWHPSSDLEPRIEEREAELFQFPNASNDDMADTTAMALLTLLSNAGKLAEAMDALAKAG